MATPVPAQQTNSDSPIWLDEVNGALRDLERELVQGFTTPQQPVIFVVGPPRSGTTLLTQLVIQHFEIGYISNLAARFWNAPYVGVRLARELSSATIPTDLQSSYGSTHGYDGPHEFGHFWMRWFNYGETHNVDAENLRTIDTGFLLRELAAIESVFSRPTIYKNLAACGMNASYLLSAVPGAIFVRIRRDRLRVACSLLAGRISRLGDPNSWYSVRPPEFSSLKDLPYHEQIAGQVASIERHLDKFYGECPDHAKLEIDYLDMLRDPAHTLTRLEDKIKNMGGTCIRRGRALPNLAESSLPHLTDEDVELLKVACSKYG